MNKTVSKEDILLAYLNNFYAGRGLYGAEAASQGYFSKKAKDLTPGEAALLMASTNNPSKYSPYTTDKLNGSETKEDLENKLLFYTNTADDDLDEPTEIELQMIDKLYSWRLIDSDTYTQLKKKTIVVRKAVPREAAKEKQKANTIAVKVAETLGDSYSECTDVMIDYLKNFGITTLLDSKTKEESYTDRYFPSLVLGGMVHGISPLEMAAAYGTLANGGTYIEPTVFTTITTFDGNLLVKANPQENRVVSEDVAYVVTDMLQAVVKEGTGKSAAIDNMAVAGKTGTTNNALDVWVYGISPLEMAAAYGTLANGGTYIEPTVFTTITTFDGNLLVKANPQENRVVSEDVAYVVTDMLQAVVKEGTGKRAAIDNMAVAGKTGTTNDALDAWFVGYTPYYVGATYIGDDAGTGEKRQSIMGTSSTAASLWSSVMTPIHKNLTPVEKFTKPDGVYFTKINPVDGGTSSYGVNAAFIEGTYPMTPIHKNLTPVEKFTKPDGVYFTKINPVDGGTSSYGVNAAFIEGTYPKRATTQAPPVQNNKPTEEQPNTDNAGDGDTPPEEDNTETPEEPTPPEDTGGNNNGGNNNNGDNNNGGNNNGGGNENNSGDTPVDNPVENTEQINE